MTEANPDSACLDRLSLQAKLRSHPPIRVIRAMRGEVISAFPRRVFGKRDRSAKDPTADRA